MREKKYIKNTAILFASMAITKIVGALFKIPLANLLGGTGMGYFSTAYGLYSPIFAVTAAGVPTVIMRITAQCMAVGRADEAYTIKKTALRLFTAIGLIGTLTVAVFAEPFAAYVACSPESAAAVLCISPAVMLCCTASVIRGYYEGMSDVMPSAAASVTESVSRAVFGLSLSYGVLFYARKLFESGKEVFGTAPASYEQAYDAALPYAAAAAVLAVSISELCGLVTLVIADRRHRRKAAPFPALNRSYSRADICRRLLKETAPIAACALVMNCVSFVDLLTVTRTISASIAENSNYYTAAFRSVLPYSGGLNGLANFMYGSYTGIAMSLFMLVPSFAGMTEKTSAPAIAAAWEKKDCNVLSRTIFTQFRAAAMIGCPACFGAAALAEPIMTMLYSSRAAEVSVCVKPFIILCLGGVFMITASSMFTVFQSVCKAHIPLILMICSVGIKLILNPVLISVPELNISGAALSSSIGYAAMTVGGAIAMKKCIPVKICIFGAVFKPALCGALCGLGAFVLYRAVSVSMSNIFAVLISVGFGAIIYIILLIFTCKFRASGIIKRNFSKKFQKPLEKIEKIG